MKTGQPFKQEQIAKERLERAAATFEAARERAAEARRAALVVAHKRPVARCAMHRTGWFDCPICGQMCFGNAALQCECGRKSLIRDRLEVTRFLRSCEIDAGTYRVESESESDGLFADCTRNKYEAMKRGIAADESWRMWPVPVGVK